MNLHDEIITKLKSQEVMDELKSRQIKHLWIFGSFAKWNWTEDSDVDLLYEYQEKNDSNLWFSFFKNEIFLENILGINVDLVDKDYIDKYIKNEILSSIKPIR